MFSPLPLIHVALFKSSRISVLAMTGAAIAIDDASAADTIRSVKQRVFAANQKLPMHRQRLVYRPGPRGMEALADDETLGGAGVAQDGTAQLDVLLADLTAADLEDLGRKVMFLMRLICEARPRLINVVYRFAWSTVLPLWQKGLACYFRLPFLFARDTVSAELSLIDHLIFSTILTSPVIGRCATRPCERVAQAAGRRGQH